MISIAQKIISHPKNDPALHIDGQTLTFGEIQEKAVAFANAFNKENAGPLSLVAILAEKTIDTYTAILGAHLAGLGYVPLDPNQPVSRMLDILEQSGTQILVASSDAVEPILTSVSPGLQIVSSDTDQLAKLKSAFPAHRFMEAKLEGQFIPVDIESEALAYLLFTSGTTGRPKGVPVSFGNLHSY